MDALDEVQGFQFVDLCSDRDALLASLVLDHLESMAHSMAQAKVVLRQLESVVFELGQI